MATSNNLEREFYADDGEGENRVEEAHTAREAAEKYIADGDYSDEESVAILVHVWRGLDEDGDRVDETTHVVVIHPPEPACDAAEDAKHRWSDSPRLLGEFRGVRGLGGAAIQSRDVCTYCALVRVETSARQGTDTEHDHRTVRYVDADEDGSLGGDPIEALARFHGSYPEGLDPASELYAQIEADLDAAAHDVA